MTKKSHYILPLFFAITFHYHTIQTSKNTIDYKKIIASNNTAAFMDMISRYNFNDNNAPYHVQLKLIVLELIGNKKYDWLDMMIQKGLNPCNITSPDDMNITLLHMASAKNDTKLAKMLIKKCKMPVDIRSSTGETPLMYARGEAIISFLSAQGANLFARDSKGNDVIHYIRHNPHISDQQTKNKLLSQISELQTAWYFSSMFAFQAELKLKEIDTTKKRTPRDKVTSYHDRRYMLREIRMCKDQKTPLQINEIRIPLFPSHFK